MEELIQTLRSWGAADAAVVKVEDIVFDRRFRAQCEANSCGCYGKNYMCPPDVGDIDDLIGHAKTYDYALVYQTVGELEDSYDFEGMMAAGENHYLLTKRIRRETADFFTGEVLHIGAGGCRECEVCAKQEHLPCRHPRLATPPMEAFGIAVSTLAKLAGMQYINGENTVTYFGAILYKQSVQ